MSESHPAGVFREQPDWHAAAQALVDGCCTLETPEHRVRFLDRLCLGFGDRLYPAFLKLLCIVSDQGDDIAKRAVAQTLVHALSTGRLPAGRLNAWGGRGTDADATFGHTRSLGPIEYLCAWRAQDCGPDGLTPVAFDAALGAVLRLVSADGSAKSLYCAKLQQDIDDPLGGTFRRHTRAALSALVRSWQSDAPIDEIVQALQASLDAQDARAATFAAPSFGFGASSWGVP